MGGTLVKLATEFAEKLGTPEMSEGLKFEALDKLSSGFAAVDKIAPNWGPKLTKYLTAYKEAEEKATAPHLQQAFDILKPVQGKSGEFVNAAEGTPSKDINVNAAAARMHHHLGSLKTEVDSATGKPMPNIPNYWPHKIDPKDLVGTRRTRLIDQLVRTGQAKNEQEAMNLIFHGAGGGVKASHFEMPRLKNLPNYRKDLSVYPETVAQGVRRIQSIKWFGKNDEVLNKFLLEIERETGNSQSADYIRGVTKEFLGRPVLKAPQSPELPTRDWVQGWSSLEAALHLSLAVTSHANKPLNVLFMHGFGPLAKATIGLAKDYGSSKEFAIRSGALMSRALAEFRQEEGPEVPFLQSIGSKVLKASGLYKVDRFFRVLASQAGREAAEDAARDFLKDPTDKLASAKLQQLGIRPGEVLASKGLTNDMALQAAKRTSDVTQFRYDVSSLPYGWRKNPWMRMIAMFKSFYFEQARFMKNNVVKPALDHGDFRPLAYLALVAPFAAEPFADLRAIVRGRYNHRPEMKNFVDRAVDNMIEGGVFGMYYELPMSLSDPSETFMWRVLASDIAPVPLVSLTGTAITGARALHSKHPLDELSKAIEKRLLYDLPYGGPYLSSKKFPPKKLYKGILERGTLTKALTR